MTHVWEWNAVVRWHFCQRCGYIRTPFNDGDRCRGSRT